MYFPTLLQYTAPGVYNRKKIHVVFQHLEPRKEVTMMCDVRVSRYALLDRREGVLTIDKTHKKSELGYLLVHFDANTGSTKRRPGAAMVTVTVVRARVYRSGLHGISVLVSGRRNAAHATLGLLSF